MSLFAIARRGADQLEVEACSAGPEDRETVPVFSDRDAASQYLADAGWGESHRVSEIGVQDLLQWLSTLNRSGVHFLTVNPSWGARDSDRAAPTVDIRSELRSAGERVSEHLRALGRQGDQAGPVEIIVHHCQVCGTIYRIVPGEAAPVCCGQTAARAATDTLAPKAQT
jgi:hypothetical protein